MTPRARSFVSLLATLAGIALTARLGLWQLDRAARKVALQQALEQRGALPPLAPGALAQRPDEADAQLQRRIRLEGRWLDGATVFLENRQMDGHPGFYVLTPLWLPAAQRAVLVQRGWAPRDPADRAHVPRLPAGAASVAVQGRVARAPARLFEFAGAASGAIRQNLDLADYAREIGVPLAPVTVVQDTPADPDDGLLRRWPHPAADVHKHYGYAFQWFALSALMAGLHVWFRILRPRLRRDA